MGVRSMLAVWVLVLVWLTAPARAEVQTKSVEYTDGDVPLRGYFAWDDVYDGRRPGVIVVHEWWGLNDYAKRRARMLARLGYVAFAVDMYGKGRVTRHGQEAGAWMKQINSNIEHWQRRALLGLDILRQHEFVDPTRIGAIGYCFGGATVMEMAYSGAELDGVVSFHGSLPAATAEQADRIKAAILVEHGARDAFVSAEQIERFLAPLDRVGVDWQMVYHSGARHGFTNPDADAYGIDNVRYHKKADERSWGQMQLFFQELFRPVERSGVASSHAP
jgi:dienelactone hydrolase